MARKIAVAPDQGTVAHLRALQSAPNLLSEHEKRTRLARELAKIDPQDEKRMAEEGLALAYPRGPAGRPRR